jgi:M6 family metalloprotease-like protein
VILALAGCTVEPASPWLGDQRVLVVPTAWSDAPQSVDIATIEDAFFGADASLAAWIEESSAGSAAITGTVLDWAEASDDWESIRDCMPEAVIAAGWAAVEDDVDPADYDADGNGLIDHLVVLHSGRTADDRISHRCMFAEHLVADFAIALQSAGLGEVGEEVPIGLYAHEAGHSFFNLRDQYGDHYHGDYGIGVWGVMGMGQWGPNADIPTSAIYRRPSLMAAPHRAKIGWTDVMVVEEDVDDLRIDPVELGGGVVRIPRDDGHVWLEVRSPRGFSAELPGHGLLVWRSLLDRKIELLQADGRDDLAHGNDLGRRPLPPIDENFGDDSDPFPGSLQVTELDIGVRLQDIRHEGDAIVLSIRFP